MPASTAARLSRQAGEGGAVPGRPAGLDSGRWWSHYLQLAGAYCIGWTPDWRYTTQHCSSQDKLTPQTFDAIFLHILLSEKLRLIA